MAFHLSDVVPWGRTFSEYEAMFSLSENDLRKSILGCSDGPAAFNYEATRRGIQVVSTDPIYRFSAEEIQARINESAPVVAKQLRENPNEFLWRYFPNVEAVIEARLSAMQLFITDYQSGTAEGRYIEASLPKLPFRNHEFDLSLCSHFLLLYSQQHDLDFHLSAINELCRVSREVRIFPLMELGSVPSRHLDNVVSSLRTSGHDVRRIKVGYEFQRGADEMLCIRVA
jgi:hypothetical protein